MVHEFHYNSPNHPNKMTVTVGKVAEQANGECIVQSGDTMVLVTAVASKEPREGIDFFPLTCEYQEKMYAVGRIPGGYIKRETKPTDDATLVARLMDRPLRPLFPDGFRNDVQIIATVLSVDPEHNPDILAMIGSSIALHISDIPFMGPTGSVRIGKVDGKFVVNPSEEMLEKSDLDLAVAGTKDAIMMVEAGANELSEKEMLDAILLAHEEIRHITDFIEEIRAEVGKEKKEFVKEEFDPELEKKVRELAQDRLNVALRNADKVSRIEDSEDVEDDVHAQIEAEDPEYYEEHKKQISAILEEITREEVRHMITVEKLRPDGRKMDEIRPLSAEVHFLPRAHGSGLFSRGQTQVLSVVTLGSPSDVQYVDGLRQEEQVKTYFHQYNFPPFCVGDTRPLRSPGRREIGHGRLAERALVPMLPSNEDFPYTIRVVSEVLSSNGSSSQASICGSTLALMDAGVPIKAPVAGIAMGLIKEGDDYSILTDIQGLEDHLGDMDFKVAGTKKGITALQMDIKITGISEKIMSDALAQAKVARYQILEVLEKAISRPRTEMSPYAPRILSMKVHPDKVREVIGPGGKVINGIIAETGVKMDIDDDGNINITASDMESGKKAKKMVEEIVKEVEVGDVYLGKVTRIMNFGAFVEVAKGKEGLVHISQLDHKRTERVEDVLNVGDEVMVKVIKIDDRGRIDLSRKALLPKDGDKRN